MKNAQLIEATKVLTKEVREMVDELKRDGHVGDWRLAQEWEKVLEPVERALNEK